MEPTGWVGIALIGLAVEFAIPDAVWWRRVLVAMLFGFGVLLIAHA